MLSNGTNAQGIGDPECNNDEGRFGKEGVSPTLTATRTRSGGFWISTRQRRMTSIEMSRLQGIPDAQAKVMMHFMSESQYNFAVGNAMTVSVLERLLSHAVYAVGFTDQIVDKWLDKDWVRQGSFI